MILFKPLTKDNIGGIIHLIIEDLNKRLADKELRIELSEEAEQFIVENGYDPVYGARPLRRAIQSEIEDMLSEAIIDGRVNSGDEITIGVLDGKFIVE